ncbi:hypothetical protein MTR_7g081785 [Medicago truncatula]|uniref:Uncharacterized protein n=1 Tax=Medicago truncatula TaxID=3880 RepID=A0A072U226_MEDTR|nr:hypothetical protein MTR_7g081785 [Medicago truncatula]
MNTTSSTAVQHSNHPSIINLTTTPTTTTITLVPTSNISVCFQDYRLTPYKPTHVFSACFVLTHTLSKKRLEGHPSKDYSKARLTVEFL